MNLAHQLAESALLKTMDLLKRYGLDRYVDSVFLTIGGVKCEWQRMGCDEVPSITTLKRQLNVTINGDMRSWRNVELEFERPDSLYGYLETGGPFERMRSAVGPIFWYPYSADKAGITKANHSLVVSAVENAIHEACEMAALSDLPKWSIRVDQETMAEQFWDSVEEHPAWPHVTHETKKEGRHPTAAAKFHFHPEPIQLDISF